MCNCNNYPSSEQRQSIYSCNDCGYYPCSSSEECDKCGSSNIEEEFVPDFT
jgi:uncharacterized OB-fold protein